ncbi:MAG: TIGR02452 family protein [Lachnospiraceae bacterium]|nr:TIGR02452 family protein [Lachnospiraceae bacterium]
MDRKATARETLAIMKNGYYETDSGRADISKLQEYAVTNSFLLTPQEGKNLLENLPANAAHSTADAVPSASKNTADIKVWNCSTVDAILKADADSRMNPNLRPQSEINIAVLNFASAKNPGGGFLNGAMAQEESLAASSSLYETLIAHEDYYKNNRACNSMMYTDYSIYSPGVPFFRDGKFRLLPQPVTASVLTLPAVNMGQVKRKGEDVCQAEQTMRRRMKLALAIFAHQRCQKVILGAYGCGVFRNDPDQIALWWKELLDEGFAKQFESVIFAVLDRSSSQSCIRAFQKVFGANTT